jgi:hypothetical protein
VLNGLRIKEIIDVNWPFIVRNKMNSMNSLGLNICTQLPFSCKKLLEQLTDVLLERHIASLVWMEMNEISLRHKKLYAVEHYCKINLPLLHRSAFSKFRCGVAPIRLETGRCENLSEIKRLCELCDNCIESELDDMLTCPMYVRGRQIMLDKVCYVDCNFNVLNDSNKLKFLFSNPDMVRTTVKTCYNMLKTSNNALYIRLKLLRNVLNMNIFEL